MRSMRLITRSLTTTNRVSRRGLVGSSQHLSIVILNEVTLAPPARAGENPVLEIETLRFAQGDMR